MNFVTRNLSQEILDMAKQYPIVTVIGPRQSGKTTLVRKIFSKKPYISFENPDERNLAKSDPRGFLEKYPNGAILDEIQRHPEILSYIQGIVDEKQKKGMFILTGSHQLELQNTVNQSLAGRAAILTLLPFSISELPIKKNAFKLDDYLFFGSYPRIFESKIDPNKFYRDYIRTYIERDVRQIINVKDLSQFRKFLKLCAGRVGQIFNSHHISNELGTSHTTIKSWLSVLEASFIVFPLNPYHENFGKRIIKSPKLYFTDVGLATYLLDIHSAKQIERDPLRGNLVENFVISEFFKNRLNKGVEPNYYFYRDSNGNEVDLISKSGSFLTPIEIKSSKTFHEDFLKGLEYFTKLAGPERAKNGILIYSGDKEQKIKNFEVLNYHSIPKIN